MWGSCVSQGKHSPRSLIRLACPPPVEPGQPITYFLASNGHVVEGLGPPTPKANSCHVMRLEAKSWQLLTQRAEVRVLERRNLQAVRAEQRTQHPYGMHGSSAVQVGKLAGARAALVDRIWLPSWRDRF